MLVVDNFLRVSCGRESVVRHEEHITKRNTLLADKFVVKKVPQIKYESDNIKDKKRGERGGREEEELNTISWIRRF